MKLIRNFLRLACFLLPYLLILSLNAQEVSLEIIEITPAEANFRITGPAGREVAIDISPDMINWEEWTRSMIESGTLEVTDMSYPSAQVAARYYLARLLPLVDPSGGLIASRSPVLGGDRVMLRITDLCDGITIWEWSVNGIAGGNETVGTIRQSPLDPCVAYYDAPVGGGDVVLQAADAGDPERKAGLELIVYPQSGELVIVPASLTIGVGQAHQFAAGIEIDGIGFLPLASALWKFADPVPVGDEYGAVDLNGVYTAPAVLPPSLPASIRVGFSFDPDQSPLMSVPVKVLDLDASPDTVVRFEETQYDNDPQTVISVQLVASDNNPPALDPADLLWATTDAAVADIDPATRKITIGTEEGEAWIQIAHGPLSISDTVHVKGRNPIRVWEVLPLAQPDVQVGNASGLIEVTQPNVSFILDPRLIKSRQLFFNMFDPNPPTFSARDISALKASATGEVLSFDYEKGQIPQQTGLTARIEDTSFVVDIGDTPGMGTVTFEYDDGEWSSSHEISLRYTRLEMTISAYASSTGGTDSSFITEWIDFDILLENPFKDSFDPDKPYSIFMGRTPVKIERTDGGTFWVSSDIYARSGTNPPGFGAGIPDTSVQVEEVQSFTGYVAAVYNTEGFPAYNPYEGRLLFSVSPTETGPVTFRISVPSDPGIPPQEVTFNVSRPSLRLTNTIGWPILPDNRVVVGSWQDVIPADDGPRVTNIAFSYETRWADISGPVWTVDKPGGLQKSFVSPSSYGSYGSFPGYFDAVGQQTVTRSIRERPDIRTNDLVVDVIDPGQLSPWPELGDNPWGSSELQRPNGMVLGAYKVISPLRPVWKPGVGIEVVIQSYDAAGNPGPVGYTTRVIRPRYNIDDTNNRILFPDPGYGPYDVTWPTYNDPQTGETNIYINQQGITRFTITPWSEELLSNYDHQADLFIGPGQANMYVDNVSFDGEQYFETVFNESDQLISSPEIDPPNTLWGATYADQRWAGLYQQIIRFSGHGMIFEPSHLPVPSMRVRQAIADGDLPAGSDQITVTAEGTEGFAESLSSGVSEVMLGDGFSLAGQSVDGEKLELKLQADYTYWDAREEWEFGRQEIAIKFGDGSRWIGEVQIFRADLHPDNGYKEWDLPLNARYGLNSEPGSVRYEIQITGLKPGFEAELKPSIDSGSSFRGATASNPLTGFSRTTDPVTGDEVARELNKKMYVGGNTYVTVYGNKEDQRSLLDNGNLSDTGNPDKLPDFVSAEPDAEQLFLRSGGNMVDYVRFTAYNFLAEARPRTGDPAITWDETLAGSLDEAYERYSTFGLPQTLEGVAADPRTTRLASVWVDHEATDGAHFRDANSSFPNYLYGQIPTQYYAGVLDQMFQAERIGDNLYPLGRDGRVRAYEPVGTGGIPTGTTRYTFGLDLDGALYDAFHGALPRPRPADLFYNSGLNPFQAVSVYGTTIAASNRLDLNPNSDELLAIPVVADLITTTGNLTGNGLLPRLGGTSGGYLDVRDDAPPRFFVESKVPGADLPGLHGGYLLKGKPLEQLDPVTELVEDDMEAVSLTRAGDIGTAAGTAPIEEDAFLGSRQQRDVLVFGSMVDKKQPIETALRVATDFAIVTDPAGFTPTNPDNWKIKAGLTIVEKPVENDFEIDLLATTQSEGDEEATKIVADAAVDLAVDLTASVVLNAITSGGYLAACGGIDPKSVATAALNLAVGLGENQILDVTPGDKGPVALGLTGTLNGLGTPIMGYEVAPIPDWSLDESKPDFTASGTNRYRASSYSVAQAPILNHCDLLGLPFSLLKDQIKSTYSVRSLGGYGSAEAVGIKVLALCIPVEAQLGNAGVYSAYASVTRRALIQPKEIANKLLSELPWQTIWESYPYPDQVSDEELFRDLLMALADPQKATAAETILRTTGAMSLTREMDRVAVENLNPTQPELIALKQQESLYQQYKLRRWDMVDVALHVGPGHQLDVEGQQAFGDYVLTPNTTVIPVSYGAVVTAGRSNENASARAQVHHGGVEMKLINAVIQEPPPDY